MRTTTGVVREKGIDMSDVFDNLSYEAKQALFWVGYIGACVGITYLMYKWLAVLFGKAVVAELIKAGVVTVL